MSFDSSVGSGEELTTGEADGREMAPVVCEPSKQAATALSVPVCFVHGGKPLKPNHS